MKEYDNYGGITAEVTFERGFRTGEKPVIEIEGFVDLGKAQDIAEWMTKEESNFLMLNVGFRVEEFMDIAEKLEREGLVTIGHGENPFVYLTQLGKVVLEILLTGDTRGNLRKVVEEL